MQECYLRALKHFDSYRGPAMKPWLFAILRNVCRAEFARRAQFADRARSTRRRRAPSRRRCGTRRRKRRKRRCCAERDATTIRRLVTALAEPFRETFVLREIHNLSYREIAEIVGSAGRHRDVPSRARPRHAAIGMDGGTGATEMTCDEAEILLHALIDGELDAGHAREVEAHIAGCPRCAAQLAAYREMRKADRRRGFALHGSASLAPPHRGVAACNGRGCRAGARCCRGFAMGSAVSAIAATGLVAIVLRNDDEQRIESEDRFGASALAAGRTSHRRAFDRPAYGEAVVQRQARCRAAGDRPDRAGLYVDRRPARLCRRPRHRRRGLPAGAHTSSICSSRRPPAPSAVRRKPKHFQGFNIRSWSERGLNYWAVSDLAADELAEFGEKFEVRHARRHRALRSAQSFVG